ncbi:sugar MFS transporter [Spirosoma sp. 209]|uniref:MFS transporter n=1 Tax=Spirosoma sp. 209 TaxID=1955701 RepID=UPI00098D405C|nr:MFS transporter [Spirosoma sp. 209]
MNLTINRSRLFNASCFALITTAMSFGIRAGVLTQLQESFSISAEQVGFINQMAFLSFAVAAVVGGPIYNIIGPQRIAWVAFASHIVGLGLTVSATSYEMLLVATFILGFGNGMVEAACNPLIASMYSGNETTKMLNRFHMWYPGGIVIGSLVSQFMTSVNLDWRLQFGVIFIPTLAYAAMFLGQQFPVTRVEGGSLIGQNLKAIFSPLYLFMLACMSLTAISEFGPNQWIEPIMKNAGANPMAILAIVTGLMAVGRFFAGPIVHRLNPTGVLLGSSIFTAIGIYSMSQASGSMIYVSAIIFAIGVCYFWPTMLGFVAEYIPKAGAFGLSIMGGIGMFSTSIFQPIIGSWLDAERSKVAGRGLTGPEGDLIAGQATLGYMVTFPLILIVAFSVLWFLMRNRKPGHVDESVVLNQPIQ